MAQQEHRLSSVSLPGPLRNAASVLRKVPGAAAVGRAVGAVSPRGRRLAVYAGAGVLGVAGVVEWPVAVTGAAVAWLAEPRSEGERARSAIDPSDGDEGAVPVVDEEAESPLGVVPVTGDASPPLGTEPPTGPAAPVPGVPPPPTPAGDMEVTGPDKPDPDLLGGGGPLTDSEDSTAPTDRTTGAARCGTASPTPSRS
ncbi:hypothetical protein ACIBL8_03750 [Streptomyces sp. NPDC050523]|uniref:hypothetical protein n=1 Tax=Streptomyces sp. NPDC050523 TaxID=3365622 RepID=UPI0037B6F221